MTNDEAGKLIKCLFDLEKCNWLEWLTKMYYNIIKVDLDNLEKSAINGSNWGKYWILWWRPKKDKTPQGLKDKTPQGKIKKPLKERESKDKDKDKENIKSKYGEYKNILLNPKEKNKLIEDYWKDIFDKYIIILDEWIEMNWYKYKNHNLAMRKWIKKDNETSPPTQWVSSAYEKQQEEARKRYGIEDDGF